MTDNPREAYENIVESVREMIDPMYWKQFRNYALTGRTSGRLVLYLMSDEKAQKAQEMIKEASLSLVEKIQQESQEQA